MSIRNPRAGVALAASVVLLAGALSGPASAAEAPAAPGCITLDNLSEKIIDGTENDLGGPFPSVGDSGTYIDHFFDSSGKKIGTLYGLINVPLKFPNGDLIELSDETIELPDGTVQATGLFNVTQGEKGVWQFLPLVGTSGKYRGMIGKRNFRIIEFRHSLEASFEMCPSGA